MVRRKLKYGCRRKAPFGTQEAAILGAAAINAATQLTAAGINSSATKEAAQRQAAEISASSTKQAEALKEQSQRSKEFQLESQEFIKEQNAENRELQKDIQMQLQMLTGQQNVNDRLEASKIQVKNGGSAKRKLRNAGYIIPSLQGSYNIPFAVTDGGTVNPVGKTPEGYDLYEIIGNDHEHYHKTKGGKSKSGVGIKFAGGGIVEGEGNQNTNQGEYLLTTPTDGFFISKHSIGGVNPAKMVNKGVHPLAAYAIQEKLKSAKGINDNGKSSSPVRKALLGAEVPLLYNMINENNPQIGTDTIGDTAVGVAYGTRNQRALRLGGRAKADGGYRYSWFDRDWVPAGNNYSGVVISEKPTNVVTTTPSTLNVSVPVQTTQHKQSFGSRVGNFVSNNADLFGAGISALGNLGGAWITSRANTKAANLLSDAYINSANIMADAYRGLTGISMDSLKREDYRAGHALPVLQAPISQAAAPTAIAKRQLFRRLANAGKYSASSAAAQERMENAETSTQDIINNISARDQAQMQEIRQNNVRMINEAAMKNAELDTQANRDFASEYLKLLQYNKDIDNMKILGAAGALSEGATNAAGAISNAQTSNGATWAQAILNSSQGFANTLSSMAARKADLQKVMLGASGDSRANYFANYASRREAQNEYDKLVAQYDLVKNSSKVGDQDTAAILRRRINIIATAKGLDTV